MTYKHLFFDLDHTLWDFDNNAKTTLQQLHIDLNLADKGIYDFDLFHRNYLHHNEKLWERYRTGHIKQDELRIKRMWLTLLDFHVADEDLCRQLSEMFLQLLPTRTLLFPDTVEVLEYLTAKDYQLHLITNGFERTQHDKLKSCSIDRYFKEVITSEGSNSLKPHKEIFEYALTRTGAELRQSIMIGDSIDVDIVGARNVGMDQVHVNYTNTPQHVKPTYTIQNLRELRDFL